MKSYKIHLIRTGSTSADPWKRYVGQSDLPLCDRGRDDLEALRVQYIYPSVELVFSSPLTRCRQTAGILYPNREVIPVEGLMDMNLGDFEGRTFEELRGNADFSAWLANSFESPPPGGEDTVSFTGRIVEALDRMLRGMMAQDATSAAAVTHGGVIMTLLAAVGLPRVPLHQWAVANGTGYTLRVNTGMWMRDRTVEVAGFLPDQPVTDDMETYGLYGEEE